MRLFRFPATFGEQAGWAMACFLLGVATHSAMPSVGLPVIGSFAAVLGAPVLIGRMIPRAAWFILLCLASGLIGFVRFDLTIPQRGDGLMPWIGQSGSFVGRVTDVGVSRGKPVLTVNVVTVNEAVIHGPANRLSATMSGTAPRVGATVSFTCAPRIPYTYPSSLDRRQSLAKRGIFAECSSVSHLSVITGPSSFDLFATLTRSRTRLTARIASVLPSENAELTAGMLYGDAAFDPSLKTAFQRAGLMHIVAVSGSNVTIVVLVLSAFLTALGIRRRWSFIVVTVTLLLFVGFVGPSASVIRAAFMGWLVLLGREFGRAVSSDRLLLFAAFTLNVLNPRLLCFDAGFALSFLAMWGLLTWAPLFVDRWSAIPKAFGLRETVAATAAATLMTAPYAAWAFGSMSLAGLATNLLVLPLVPWTMLWGAMSALWGDLIGGTIVAAPVYGLTDLILWIARFGASIPWLNGTVAGMALPALLGTYLLIWSAWRAATDDGSLSTVLITSAVVLENCRLSPTGSDADLSRYTGLPNDGA